MADRKTSGTVSGAASGAAAGGQMGGGWGALIGGVLGGAAGYAGAGDDPKMGRPEPAPAPQMPGAVSGNWGGMYRDPITGAVYFTDQSGYGQASPQYWQNMALYDQLMGGGSGVQSQLQGQLAQLQLQLEQAQAQAGKKIDIRQFVPPEWLDAGGNIIDISDPNSIGRKSAEQDVHVPGAGIQPNRSGALWNRFMADTGGRYGSKNMDISFAKWVRDAYKNNIQGAVQQYQNALKEHSSNQDAISRQILGLKSQIGALQGAQEAYGGVSGRANPLLQNINQLDEYARGAGQYGTVLNEQTNRQVDEAMRQSQDEMARRGLSGSGVGEMMRARLGLQKAQQLNENTLTAQDYGANAVQRAQAARLGLMGFLTGQQNNQLQNQIAATGANMNQLGLGYNASAGAANAINNWNVANVGQTNAYNMGLANLQNMNAIQNQQNWNSAAGAIGYGLGSYFGRDRTQPRTSQPGAANQGFGNWNGDWNSAPDYMKYGAGD